MCGAILVNYMGYFGGLESIRILEIYGRFFVPETHFPHVIEMSRLIWGYYTTCDTLEISKQSSTRARNFCAY